MDRKEWYFEYELQNNRPGLLGDISSLLGMLSINIIMINSIENSIRGMLLLSKDDENITRLQTILKNVDTVKIKKLRVPKITDRKEWYFEYELQNNRPGLLGDISSLLGMLSINIIMINSIENSIRGMLLLSKDDENITRLQTILKNVDTVKIKKLRVPKITDRLAVRHGKYIHLDEKNRKTVKFVREEFGILVDF